MPTTNNPKLILKTALAAVMRQTGLVLDIDNKAPGKQFLLLKTPKTTVKLELLVIEGGTIAVNAMLAIYRRQQDQTRCVVIIPQVTADMADRLRDDDTQFLDTAGNCFINEPPFYIYIKGNKLQGVVKAPVVGRAFKQTGLRVLYALLCNPGLENETYRAIAAKTDVALGMVNWVLNELNELGYLVETGKGRARHIRLIGKEKLLERWITGYAEQLRPKLLMGRYQGADGWWQKAVLKPEKAQWGGEVAAGKLTDYLKPQTITVYVDKDNPEAVLIQHRLKKDPQGDVELLQRFWQPDTIVPQGETVHPILVYADLMATGNQRNIETARILYDEHIVQLIRED
jgi:hypothetical protein